MYSAITQAMGPLVSWPESQNPTLSYKITLRAGSIKYGTPCSFGNLRNNNLKSPLAASQDTQFNSQGYLYRCGAQEPRSLHVAGTGPLLHGPAAVSQPWGRSRWPGAAATGPLPWEERVPVRMLQLCTGEPGSDLTVRFLTIYCGFIRHGRVCWRHPRGIPNLGEDGCRG